MNSSDLKTYLKQAKNDLERNNPEDALDSLKTVLKIDRNNYLGYVFQGKSYLLLNNITKSLEAFKKAVDIEPDNILGWKGYIQVAKVQDDFNIFFDVLEKLIETQVSQGISIADSLKTLQTYLSCHNYKSNMELHELYLRRIIPGTILADCVGTHLGNPISNLLQLIELVKKKEKNTIALVIGKEKMRYSRVLTQEQKNHLDNMTWSIVEENSLSDLYDLLLNTSNDDEIRLNIQDEYLKYTYFILKIAPDKKKVLDSLKDMVEGFVLIKTSSLFCWQLYFDFADKKHLSDLNVQDIVYVIRNFPQSGLASVLKAFLYSEISPFDKSVLKAGKDKQKGSEEHKQAPVNHNEHAQTENEDSDTHIQEGNKEATEADELEFTEDPDKQEEENTDEVYPEEILSLLTKGYESCMDSVLANRIICHYFLHIKEYANAAVKCRNAIKILADLQRNMGINLPNSRQDLLCSLGVVYTYHEAPKNYTKALQLFERILENDPDSVDASIGKGLILLERNNINDADRLFKDVLSKHPQNIQAQVEHSWCEILLLNVLPGREGLENALKSLPGGDLISRKTRADINWRIAKSYLLAEDKNVDKAYSHLVTSLKESQLHAPSYTLLGIVYQDYFKDLNRALKSFYKAFELDSGEIFAARSLVENLSSKHEWDLAKIICERVIQSDRAKKILYNSTEDRSWPYRVLGCACMNDYDDSKAVEWFQAALRLSSEDLESWIGVGEAYYHCGKFEAARKVFYRVLEEYKSWTVKYMLGIICCGMGDFNEGIFHLEEAHEIKPSEECILNGLYESAIALSLNYIDGGFIGKAYDSNIKALEYILEASKVNKNSRKLWSSLGECLRVFALLKPKDLSALFEYLNVIFEDVDFGKVQDSFFEEINEKDGQISPKLVTEKYEAGENIDAIWHLVVLAAKCDILTLPKKSKKEIRSILYYNMGLAYFELFNFNQEIKFREISVECFKKAIQLESDNSTFWIALGNASVSGDPALAQHCFIKSMSLGNNDGDTWCNLAALYLRYGDLELALQAFLRAQSVIPQKPEPWLGQALTARAKGDGTDTFGLFTHAYILSNGRSPIAQLLYSLTVVEKMAAESGGDPRDIETFQIFSVANFAIQSYLKTAPEDELALKIALIISERCKAYDTGVSVGERLLAIFARKHETTGDEVSLIDYTRTKTQVARLLLGLSDHEAARADAQEALDIICGLESYDEQDEQHQEVMLSSRVVLGLASFLTGDFDDALDQLKMILAVHNDSATIIALTAQILHAYDSDETRQAAVDQLLAYIEEFGSNLTIVLTLAAIAVVDNLDDFLVAVRDELHNLPLESLISDQFKKVPQLLIEINSRLGVPDASKSWQRNAILFPHDYNIWRQINSRVALTISSLRDIKINASDLALSLVDIGNLRLVQRSLILCPHNTQAAASLRLLTDS